MKQDLKVIALDENNEVIAIIENSTLAKDAEGVVDGLNEMVSSKKFDNLGLDINIEYFDWRHSRKVDSSVPTISELIDSRKEVISDKEILAQGGNLLDLMMA